MDRYVERRVNIGLDAWMDESVSIHKRVKGAEGKACPAMERQAKQSALQYIHEEGVDESSVVWFWMRGGPFPLTFLLLLSSIHSVSFSWHLLYICRYVYRIDGKQLSIHPKQTLCHTTRTEIGQSIQKPIDLSIHPSIHHTYSPGFIFCFQARNLILFFFFLWYHHMDPKFLLRSLFLCFDGVNLCGYTYKQKKTCEWMDRQSETHSETRERQRDGHVVQTSIHLFIHPSIHPYLLLPTSPEGFFFSGFVLFFQGCHMGPEFLLSGSRLSMQMFLTRFHPKMGGWMDWIDGQVRMMKLVRIMLYIDVGGYVHIEREVGHAFLSIYPSIHHLQGI